MFFIVHGASDPTDVEWNSMLRAYQDALAQGPIRTLVYSTTGEPTLEQIKEFQIIRGQRTNPITSLTSAMISNDVFSAFELIGIEKKAGSTL